LEAKYEADFNLKHITEVVEERTGPFYFFLDRIRISYGDLIYLPLLWFFWQTFKNIKDKKRLAVLIWFFVPLIFFSIAETKMQAYILFTAPALFIVTAEFWVMLSDIRKAHRLKWAVGLLMILFIAFPIRYAIERVKPFEYRDRTPEWVNDLKRLNENHLDNGILLNYNRPIEAMFYTNLTAYPYIPDKKVITELMNKGHTVIINDDGLIPADIKTMDGLLFKRLVTAPNNSTQTLPNH
jgi:4-amino-4-deoxy-L-arabinose transferase